MLEIKGLKKAFGSLEVLKGVDLKVKQGDVVAILGPSGSGKTTMLRCVNFLEHADGGSLIFDGKEYPFHNISKKDIAAIRQKTAFVFQNYNLFLNKTALHNVTEGLIIGRKMPKTRAEEKARAALEKVGMLILFISLLLLRYLLPVLLRCGKPSDLRQWIPDWSLW